MQNALNRDNRDNQQHSVSALLSCSKRFFYQQENIEVIKLFSGDFYVTSRPGEMLVTILGSCIAACIRDPFINVGGMNHFLLPGDENIDLRHSESARYGVFAMESLINAILTRGGRKERLEVKVFGGGNVTNNSTQIGSKNAQFIRNYLRNEGLRIESEDLEGNLARRIHYYPTTGRVMLRLLKRKEDLVIVDEEIKYCKSIKNINKEGEIELF